MYRIPVSAGKTVPITMNASGPRRSTRRPANGENSRIGKPNIAKVSPMRAEVGAEALQEQAPDDLVGPAREVAPDVEDQGRDQAAVEEARRAPAGRALRSRGRRPTAPTSALPRGIR